MAALRRPPPASIMESDQRLNAGRSLRGTPSISAITYIGSGTASASTRSVTAPGSIASRHSRAICRTIVSSCFAAPGRERPDHELAVLVVLRRVHLEDRLRDGRGPVAATETDLDAARGGEALRVERDRDDVGVLEHTPGAARARVPGQGILAPQPPERGVRVAEEELRLIGREDVGHVGPPSGLDGRDHPGVRFGVAAGRRSRRSRRSRSPCRRRSRCARSACRRPACRAPGARRRGRSSRDRRPRRPRPFPVAAAPRSGRPQICAVSAVIFLTACSRLRWPPLRTNSLNR